MTTWSVVCPRERGLDEWFRQGRPKNGKRCGQVPRRFSLVSFCARGWRYARQFVKIEKGIEVLVCDIQDLASIKIVKHPILVLGCYGKRKFRKICQRLDCVQSVTPLLQTLPIDALVWTEPPESVGEGKIKLCLRRAKQPEVSC